MASKNGNKTHGRNAAKCKQYREQGRREKNKQRKAARRARERERWLSNREARTSVHE